jgi:uncharacterized membrane protein
MSTKIKEQWYFSRQYVCERAVLNLPHFVLSVFKRKRKSSQLCTNKKMSIVPIQIGFFLLPFLFLLFSFLLAHFKMNFEMNQN